VVLIVTAILNVWTVVVQVVFWVLNTEEEWKLAFDLGADGVMTGGSCLNQAIHSV